MIPPRRVHRLKNILSKVMKTSTNMTSVEELVFTLSVNVFKSLEPIEFSLRQLRKFYPHHKVFVFELVSDKLEEICERYNCERIRRPENVYEFTTRYCRFIDFDAFTRRLDDLVYCLEHGGDQVKWVLNMEPDVLIRGHIEEMPPRMVEITSENPVDIAIGGIMLDFNCFNKKCSAILDERNTSRRKNVHSFAGGSVASAKFLKTLKDNLRDARWLYDCMLPHSLHDDLFFSALAYWLGFEIHEWDQVMEVEHTFDKKQRLLAPIVHGFKYFY